MNHQYSNCIELLRIINSININRDATYREIFDNAVLFKYGKNVNECDYNNINAIMVNNIRHKYSNYDLLLKRIHKIKNNEDDYFQFKNSVLYKIGQAYPFLKDECFKQRYKLNMVNMIDEVG